MTTEENKITVMPSNNTGFSCGRLFGKYPNSLAHLMSSSPQKKHLIAPKENIPWALDNGVFGAWQNNREWSEEPFYTYLENFHYHKPLWAVVPDWVGDKTKTLELWEKHSPAVSSFDVPLAFAVQDGMEKKEVPQNAEIIFVGGSTSWKWKTLNYWTANFNRVHVGRVNTYKLCMAARKSGAESCDGTGWFRCPKRTNELERFLEDQEQKEKQKELFNEG